MTLLAVGNLLDRCLGVRRGEEVLLIADDGTDVMVLEVLMAGIANRGAVPVLTTIPRPRLPGSEPPAPVASAVARADAAIELTSLFIGSSRARQQATAGGTRYISMPGVVHNTFRDGGPLTVDFDSLRDTASAVGASWGNGSSYRLTSRGGTELIGSIAGRPGRVLDGIARDVGAYMAPPDVEAGTAPVEGTSSGVVVIDADLLFMGPGPLKEPVVVDIDKGEITGVEGMESHRLTEMIERCEDDRMMNLAEVSVGLNPLGTVCGVPMETESALGTAHVAFGNSIAYGGTVPARAHLDCVMKNARLEIDGVLVIADGVLS